MPKFSLQLTAALCFSCIIAILAGDFMHGAKDTGATALSLAELAGADQASLIEAEGLPDGAKGTGLIALSNQSITFKNPVIPNEKIGDFSGKILRFYVWIKADGLVAKNLWFDAPTITLDLDDDYGATLVHASSLFKTRGTYPWHCYYVDVKLPQHITISGKAANALSDDLQALLDAAGDTFGDGDVTLTQPGLYLTLSAMGEGTATFGGISLPPNNLPTIPSGWILPAEPALPIPNTTNCPSSSISASLQTIPGNSWKAIRLSALF